MSSPCVYPKQYRLADLIADGYEIVPCKLLITYKNLPESPQYTAYFGEWNFSPRLPDRLFNFVPPAETSQIEFVPHQ